MTEREPHKLEAHELRYAEGKREADECRCCGQDIWRVYHGPNRNHTIERRSEGPEDVQEKLDKMVYACKPPHFDVTPYDEGYRAAVAELRTWLRRRKRAA